VVKIQIRVSKRRYLRAKRTYEYERMSLDIPRKFHEALKPLIQQDFIVDVKPEKDSVVITLTPAKTFRHAANTCQKQQEKLA